jgi:formyl-CoA transferase
MDILAKAGIPCSAVLDTSDVWRDPHLQARGFLHTVEHPTEGTVHLLGAPLRLAGTKTHIERAPLLGEHTDEVLAAELGLDASTLEELRTQKIIH